MPAAASFPDFPSREGSGNPDSEVSSSNHHLVQFLVEQIEARGRITFAQYMEWVLYHPQWGYYSRAQGLGPQGDFVTSSHLCSDFGELLAVQFIQMWKILGKPKSFQLLEMGAGQGILAADVLQGLGNEPACLAALEYCIIERSERLRSQQRSHFQHLNLPKQPQWLTWDEIEPNSITGCCFSNELVDALPVHLIEVRDGQLFEVYLTSKDDQFIEQLDELSTPTLQSYFDDLELDLSQYPNGYRSEVNLAARAWLTSVAQRLHRGYCLTIDYGYSAERYYLPSRNQGTLQAYFQHHHHNDPYINIGQQDLTAHVNFTALEQWGEQLELSKRGFTQQALLLMGLGLGDRIAALASEATDIAAIQQAIQRREVLHQLMNPLGLGGFGALVQSKGLTPEQMAEPLRGWIVPPMT